MCYPSLAGPSQYSLFSQAFLLALHPKFVSVQRAQVFSLETYRVPSDTKKARVELFDLIKSLWC